MQQMEYFMQRCFSLALIGVGKTSPNPLVGAVLVYKNKIIGEGYHAKYGGPHAEVEAIKSVSNEDLDKIPFATLYVSLEPCCIYGNTPPCTLLIIEHKIPNVIISCLDINPKIAGKGVQMLKNAGIKVIEGVMEREGMLLNKMRNKWVKTGIPYIILKFALSREGFLASPDNQQIWLSGWLAKRITHQWRNEIDAILIGSKTLQIDNPSLTSRYGYLSNPTIVILAPETLISNPYKIFESGSKIIIFSKFKPSISYPYLIHIDTSGIDNLIPYILKVLGEHQLTSLMVEGGAQVLNSFIDQGFFDEIRVFRSPKGIAHGKRVNLPNTRNFEKSQLGDDELEIFYN
jgi:diaminohydroxyphosphoribosylaminopyrimidine deaminase/5-amino-6-(5-phosphoribosylamino)uracil reductase